MKSRISLLKHMHMTRTNTKVLSFVVMGAVLLTAFQNCGEFKSSSSFNTGSYASTSFEDADIQFSKTELSLKESDASPFDVVAITAKAGRNARFTYELMQLDDAGQAVNTTVLGQMSGSATLSEAFPESEIRISGGSQQMVKAAVGKTLFLLISKEEPTVNSFAIPIRIIAATNGTPGTTPPGNQPPGNQPPKVITPDNASVTERQDKCVQFITQRPTISNNINDTVLNLGFGLSAATNGTGGPASEGNQISSSISISITKGITDQANFTLWKCETNAVQTFQIVTDVVTGAAGNTDRPVPSFTNALQATGAARDYSTDTLRNQLAADVYAINGGNNNANQITLTADSSTTSFTMNPRYAIGNNRSQKCVEGSVWLRVRAVLSYANRNNNNSEPQFAQKMSDPQYIRLNIQNNCWKENRLRLAGNANYATQISLGSKVAISGDWSAALAENDSIDTARQNVGAIYMYKKENGAWVQKGSKLTVNELSSNQNIRSIAIKGDVLVAGVPTNGRGKIYVFRRSGDTWNLAHTIDSAFTTENPQFGFTVAMNSTHIAVGTPYANKVYLYPYTSTTVGAVSTINMPATMTINGENFNDYLTQRSFFGAALAMTENQLVIGAPLEPGVQHEVPGSVHIYSLSAGSATYVKSYAGTQVMDRFGSNVVVNGNRLAIASADFKNDGGTSIGRVNYYHDYTATTTTPTRFWDGSNANSLIGNGLAITANGIYIGLPNSVDIDPPGLVMYYPFSVNSGGQKDYSTLGNLFRLRAYNEEAGTPGRFGWSMATDGNNIMIGAKNKRDGVLDGGAAFIYEAR